MHPVLDSEKMELPHFHRSEAKERDATVCEAVRLVEEPRLALEAKVRPRAETRARCSCCGRPAAGYDRLPVRRFELVPLWGIAVFFFYPMRRVACKRCGVRVETVPWAQGKHQLTDTYAWLLAGWAKRLSCKDVPAVFYTTWEKVVRSVEMVVARGWPIRTPLGVRPLVLTRFSGNAVTAT